MDKITVYQKRTCSKCRELLKKLGENGVTFEAVDYYVEPLSQKKLTELVSKMGVSPAELLRTKESVYGEVNPGGESPSDVQAIEWMVKYPDLLQRPIVEKGDKAILARPLENLGKIFPGFNV